MSHPHPYSLETLVFLLRNLEPVALNPGHTGVQKRNLGPRVNCSSVRGSLRESSLVFKQNGLMVDETGICGMLTGGSRHCWDKHSHHLTPHIKSVMAN